MTAGNRKNPYPVAYGSEYRDNLERGRKRARDRFITFLVAMFVIVSVAVFGITKASADVPMGETCSQVTINQTSGNWENLYHEAVASQQAVLDVNQDLTERVAALEGVVSNKDVVIMNQKTRILRLQEKIKEMRR